MHIYNHIYFYFTPVLSVCFDSLKLFTNDYFGEFFCEVSSKICIISLCRSASLCAESLSKADNIAADFKIIQMCH